MAYTAAAPATVTAPVTLPIMADTAVAPATATAPVTTMADTVWATAPATSPVITPAITPSTSPVLLAPDILTAHVISTATATTATSRVRKSPASIPTDSISRFEYLKSLCDDERWVTSLESLELNELPSSEVWLGWAYWLLASLIFLSYRMTPQVLLFSNNRPGWTGLPKKFFFHLRLPLLLPVVRALRNGCAKLRKM
jgi:hypothetical protein